jgi:hypothetical protein
VLFLGQRASPLHKIIWAGVTASQATDQYFFDVAANSASHLACYITADQDRDHGTGVVSPIMVL